MGWKEGVELKGNVILLNEFTERPRAVLSDITHGILCSYNFLKKSLSLSPSLKFSFASRLKQSSENSYEYYVLNM